MEWASRFQWRLLGLGWRKLERELKKVSLVDEEVDSVYKDRFRNEAIVFLVSCS